MIKLGYTVKFSYVQYNSHLTILSIYDGFNILSKEYLYDLVIFPFCIFKCNLSLADFPFEESVSLSYHHTIHAEA